jgi:hypothetical protein
MPNGCLPGAYAPATPSPDDVSDQHFCFVADRAVSDALLLRRLVKVKEE